jgi:hypothetical protein
MLAGNPYEIDGVRVRFIRHDHGFLTPYMVGL